MVYIIGVHEQQEVRVRVTSQTLLYGVPYFTHIQLYVI